MRPTASRTCYQDSIAGATILLYTTTLETLKPRGTASRRRRSVRANVAEDEAVDSGGATAKPERRALFALAAAGFLLVALAPLALYFLWQTSFEGFVAAALAQGAVYAAAVYTVLRYRFDRAALSVVFIVAVV